MNPEDKNKNKSKNKRKTPQNDTAKQPRLDSFFGNSSNSSLASSSSNVDTTARAIGNQEMQVGPTQSTSTSTLASSLSRKYSKTFMIQNIQLKMLNLIFLKKFPIKLLSRPTLRQKEHQK